MARRAVTLVSILVIVAAALIVVLLRKSSSPQPLGIPGRWKLVFNTNFDGTELPARWQTGWFKNGVTTPVNPALEDDCYSPRNITFPGDDTMHLLVTKVASRCDGVSRPFTGALVSTNPSDGRGKGFEYTYGVMQARVYLPADGAKLADWPGVWAVSPPGEKYGEDDVIEGLSGKACWHFHRSGGASGGCAVRFTPGWHTVASYWRKGAITFYYDGKKVGTITSGVTSHPMYLVLDNTAVAGSAVPDSMRVRYVRVWQRVG